MNESLVSGRPEAEWGRSLESEVRQKDELIAALIHELEQAVEKLDRFERIGSDRSLLNKPPSLATPSKDLASCSPPVLEQIQRMAEDWEWSQPHSQLDRIESTLAAVQELLLKGERGEPSFSREPHERKTPSTNQHHRREQSSAHAEPEVDVCNVTLDESSPTWEIIKNQLLVDEAPNTVRQPIEDDAELMKLMSETPAPIPVDFNLANPDTLKRAIEERDAYIVQLNRLIRARHTFSIPKDWADLANVPTQLQQRVETLIQHLDVQVRLGEVEMSLERARLARERSQFQSERDQVERHLRRLRISSLSELDNISAAPSSTSDRRWMRFLGPSTR